MLLIVLVVKGHRRVEHTVLSTSVSVSLHLAFAHKYPVLLVAQLLGARYKLPLEIHQPGDYLHFRENRSYF